MCLGYLKWVCLGILQYGQLKTHTVQTELLTIKWLGEVLTSSSNGVNLLQFRTSCPGWTSSALPTMATWCRTSCLSWWSCSSTTTMTTSLSSGWHSTRSNSTLTFWTGQWTKLSMKLFTQEILDHHWTDIPVFVTRLSRWYGRALKRLNPNITRTSVLIGLSSSKQASKPWRVISWLRLKC